MYIFNMLFLLNKARKDFMSNEHVLNSTHQYVIRNRNIRVFTYVEKKHCAGKNILSTGLTKCTKLDLKSCMVFLPSNKKIGHPI